MASTRFRVAGLILVFIVSLLALERLCSANAHAQLARGRKENQAKANEAANCDDFGYGRKGLGGRNGCNNFQQKPESKMSKTESAKLRPGKLAFSKAESQAFLQARHEVYQLIRKDYGVHGRPRHKPPINNHEPTD